MQNTIAYTTKLINRQNKIYQTRTGQNSFSSLFSDPKIASPLNRKMSGGVSTAAAGSDAAADAPSEPILQYVILRKDLFTLSWPLGSIVAQGCHAATAALWLSKDTETTQTYCSAENIDHMHKVWQS